MSNLWLNQDLVQKKTSADSTATHLLSELDDTLPLGFTAQRDDYSLLQRAHQADRRRFLIQALSLVLLLASAAFSYLAWSDSLVSGLDSPATLLGAAVAVEATDLAANEAALESNRGHVIVMREENQRLRERVTAAGILLSKTPSS